MPYSKEPNNYDHDLLLQVAHLLYDVDKPASHEEIRARLKITSRHQVAAMCEALHKSGLVHIAIMPPRTDSAAHLHKLETRVRERFGLVDCRLVPGRVEMLTEDLQASAREVIVDAITREAASCLDFRFGEEEKPCLAVVYGFITRKIADFLQAEDGLRRSKNAQVVSAHGVRSVQIDRFDANTIAHDIGRRFGCEYACLPLPFLIPTNQAGAVRKLPFVDTVLNILENDINMALLGIASRHQQEDYAPTEATQKPTSLQNELKLTEEDKKAVAGAAATIGGHWFDYEGNDVGYAESMVPGLTLRSLKRLVNIRRSVLLACGADCTRLPGLAIALKHKMCSIWIGCEASAMALLGDQEVARPDINWSDEEESILAQLKDRSYVSGRNG